MNIEYTVNSEKFNIDLDVEGHSPRSIVIACEQDYQSKTGNKVTPAYYNDDYDIYIAASVDVKVVVTKSLCNELRMKNYFFDETDTDEDFKEMFE